MDTASYAAKYIKNDFPLEVMTWLSYLFIPAIGSMLSSCYLLFCGLLLIYAILMDIQFLIYFRIQRDMVDLFDITMIKISIAGEKEHVLYHGGHGVDANVAYTFNGSTLHRMHLLFKATI
jgi:hypothetical protein